MVEPTVAAYAAGLVDGDGCIQVNRKQRDGWSYYSISVSVSQVSEDATNWMMKNFGGKVNKFIMSKERRQPVYRWSLYCKQAGVFLQTILPFLVQKAERAKVAIKIQESMQTFVYLKKGSEAPVRQKPSEEIQASRLDLFNRMKSMNKQFGRNHWSSKKELI